MTKALVIVFESADIEPNQEIVGVVVCGSLEIKSIPVTRMINDLIDKHNNGQEVVGEMIYQQVEKSPMPGQVAYRNVDGSSDRYLIVVTDAVQ